jgi:hypothetical protein
MQTAQSPFLCAGAVASIRNPMRLHIAPAGTRGSTVTALLKRSPRAGTRRLNGLAALAIPGDTEAKCETEYLDPKLANGNSVFGEYNQALVRQVDGCGAAHGLTCVTASVAGVEESGR